MQNNSLNLISPSPFTKSLLGRHRDDTRHLTGTTGLLVALLLLRQKLAQILKRYLQCLLRYCSVARSLTCNRNQVRTGIDLQHVIVRHHQPPVVPCEDRGWNALGSQFSGKGLSVVAPSGCCLTPFAPSAFTVL